MMRISSKLNGKGFTLMEIVLVMAVLTILTVACPKPVRLLRNGREIERRNHEELVNKALRQYYAYEGHYPDPDPHEADPVEGVLTDAQEQRLRDLLRLVTTVRIDTEKYVFTYSQSTGKCTLSLS